VSKLRAEELDNLTEEELLEQANICSITAENKGNEMERLLLHLQAQYYVTAVARKRDDRVADRDFRMEVWVIVLIGLEILLSLILEYTASSRGINKHSC
jgi:hypothetical protein